MCVVIVVGRFWRLLPMIVTFVVVVVCVRERGRVSERENSASS